jgi:hypothetical protein
VGSSISSKIQKLKEDSRVNPMHEAIFMPL